MLKKKGGKSTARKPLIDVSNGRKPLRIAAKKQTAAGKVDGGALDRLLLARSDLSNLFTEIDELVAQAMVNKRLDRKVDQEVESFRNVLSEMHSSLKPWVLRLHEAFSSTLTTGENQLDQIRVSNSSSSNNVEEFASPEQNKTDMELAVSPSPLVSWHAGCCTLERGKQLFLLTPLPKGKAASSVIPSISKPMFRLQHNKNKHDTLELPRVPPMTESTHEVKACTGGKKNSGSESEHFSAMNCISKKDTVFLVTPLHDLISEKSPELPSQADNSRGSSDLSSDGILENLASRYPGLLGLKPGNNVVDRRKDVNQTLDWFLSPPKTCVLMEPAEGKPMPTPLHNSMLVLATPLWKDVESTVHKGKKAGENTLKKELWTRFEEASREGLHFDASIFQKSEQKGFLDMLEEACESSDFGNEK